MRVTIDKDDPDYIGSTRRSIVLNGSPIDCVVEASTSEGYADVAMLDDDGFLDVDPVTDEIRKHRVFGRIEIIDAMDPL